MVRKVLKWIGIVLGGLVGLIVLAAVALYASAGARLNKTYTIQPETITIPTDEPAIERGQRLASIYCTGCHGVNLSGTVVFDDPSIARFVAPNLTSGQGGIGGTYTDADWVLAIRHGVRPDGTPLLGMPSGDFYYFSDEDLGAIIAYLKSLPPADNELGRGTLTPLAKVLFAVGVFGDVIEAETIDHTGPRPQAPQPGVTVEYGEYLVKTYGCQTCHGSDLAGAQPPNPDSPPAPNITPGGVLRAWSEADFITAARTRPEGFMPWKGLSHMTDDELKAIWLYLQSLPAK